MSDRYTRYSEKIVKQPLPLCLRQSSHYFVFFAYLIGQVYICTICARWRRDLKMSKAVPANNSTVPSFNNATNLTETSFTDTIPSNTNFTSISSNSTTGIDEDIKPLYAHAFLAVIFMLCCHILIYAFRTKNQLVFGFAISYLSWIVSADCVECRTCRQEYINNKSSRKLCKWDENILKKVLTFQEKSSIFRFWNTTWKFWNPTVNCFGLAYPSIDCTLSDYMFFNLRGEDVHQILGAIELIHDVMKALDYLHYRNTYHLNLTAEGVKLHCNGRKIYVKLSNFNFMKRAVDKKVSSTSVGLRGFYRPIECSVEQDVDAEKCDIWGLGLVTLDLFTGGMFRILTETEDWDVQNNEEYVLKLVQRRPFFGYVQETYGVIEMFQDARYRSYTMIETGWNKVEETVWLSLIITDKYKSYNISHLNFLYELRCFVYRMLIINPRRRISLDKAFQEPLITRRRFSKENAGTKSVF